jgi:ankyrin repeat protein
VVTFFGFLSIDVADFRRVVLRQMPVVSVPKDFRCSITTGIFRVPVFTADGFTYERSAIERHFSDGNDKSPLTNEPLRNRNLVPNNNLKSQIESFRETVLSANKFKTAIETGDLKTLKSSSFLPLDEYKDINPLFLAVETGQLNVLQYLLKECGENPTTLKDDAGNTLLHRAGNSSPKMVRYLVRDCKLKLEEKNRAGRTPLLQILTDRAARRSHSVIKELLELGADPKFSIDNANVLIAGVIGLPLAKMLVMKGAGVPAVVEQFFADGSSILHRHWSHTQKAVKVFEYFFSLIPTEARRIAIVRRIRNDGQTLLHASVRNPEILKILLGTPYSLSVAAVDKNGRNALHQWAMRAEHSDASEETLRLLLAAGIDINAKTPAGKTALHFAKADMRRFHQLMAAGASSNDVFDSLTVANLRLLYHRSIGLIKEGNRTNPNETYVGKKVEAFNNSENCWMPAEIVEV